MVKSWMIDDLLPIAIGQYGKLETLLNIEVVHPMPVYKILSSVKEQNDWVSKSDIIGYKDYLSPVTFPSWDHVETPYGVGVIQNTYWIDIKKIVVAFREWLNEREELLDEPFRFESLELKDDYVVYKGIKAKRIVFCEGYKGMENPFFAHLPFVIAKGEVLNIFSEELNFSNGILNKNGLILPVGKDVFRIGATYKWNDPIEVITPDGKVELVKKLENITSCNYEILGQEVGIRPTVKDRRPFLGVSPQNDKVIIFNGMGTKGISLSPYFANHLIEFLESDIELITDVNVNRFEN